MTKINQTSQKKMALLLAQTLDSKDGKQDGKISANVWNDFVKDKGGKTINSYISIENATQSISTYLAKNSQSTGKDKGVLFTDWFIQSCSANKNKGGTIDASFLERDLKQLQRKEALKPERIESDANYVAKYVTGHGGDTCPFPNPHNCAQVFLKASNKFQNGKLPNTLGTTFYLASLYPTLIKKAKELGISTYYKEGQRFNNIEDKLTACRDLAMQISDKEKGIPSWQTNV